MPVVTFSSSPNTQYTIWFLATPYPIIVTDMLSGHNGLFASVAVKNKQVKVAHPIHTIFLHLYNQLAITDQGIFQISNQISTMLQDQIKHNF